MKKNVRMHTLKRRQKDTLSLSLPEDLHVEGDEEVDRDSKKMFVNTHAVGLFLQNHFIHVSPVLPTPPVPLL